MFIFLKISVCCVAVPKRSYRQTGRENIAYYILYGVMAKKAKFFLCMLVFIKSKGQSLMLLKI